ncbi:MAG: hypothetical protein J0I99_07565 [Devosia sp.]|uniref:hypothetical protein n=1 Tax=Devosia sp. TaxID=1871048 RepID=UPI001AC3EDDE|nr:hypothetical protein [Devosia sp.]MBN9315577.1 hypothetical protein [Devosia sp.]
MHDQIQLVPAGVADALVRNELTDIIPPLLRYIEGWQLRSSYLKGQLAVHPPGSEEYGLAQRRTEELRREIEAHRRHLIRETAQLPPDDRIDGLLQEMDGLLLAISGAERRAS